MFLKKAIILWNKNIGSSYFKIGLDCPDCYEDAKPGQFIMMRIGRQFDPLLGRPFSIHRKLYDDGKVKGIEVLYKIAGKGTSMLANLKKNEIVGILGPLGNGFKAPEFAETVFIVSGGVGIAPLFFLILYLEKLNFDMSKFIFFSGAKSKEDLLCMEDLSQKGLKVNIATDDGTCGEKGMVTEILEKSLKTNQPGIVYACGPLPMLKTISLLSEKYGFKAQVSLETNMACGIGACLGCAVETGDKDKYAHVCKDGPVFDLNDIRL